MAFEMIVWLAVNALVYEAYVLTAILAVRLGYELAGRGPDRQRVPLGSALWQALRGAAVAGALVAVAARVIVNSASSFVAGQWGDWFALVAAGMAVGAAWRLRRAKREKCGDKTGADSSDDDRGDGVARGSAVVASQ